MYKIRRKIEQITGVTRLKKEEKELRERLFTCNDEEERRKINKKRKKVRKQRLIIRRRLYIIGMVLCTFILTLLISFGWVQGKKAIGKLQKTREEKKIAAEKMTETESETETETEGEPVELLLSFTGDCILGTDELFAWDTGFNAYYQQYGGEYFFKNVKDIFEKDDLTIVNMEGTLTEETTRLEKQFAFKGDPEFVDVLTYGSVEAANLANNHSHDYGEQSFLDTVNILEENNIRTFGYDDTALIEIKGVKVGLFGIYELDDHLERIEQMKRVIADLKEKNADVIVGIFHWSNELVTVPDENQVTLAHMAIDEGVDVVVGHHPHVVQGLETYKGKTIAYSLGNFCFGGNTYPKETDTMIFQQKFTVSTKGEIIDSSYEVIPCSVSSVDWINNYQPTVLEGAEAERVMNLINERSSYIVTETE